MAVVINEDGFPCPGERYDLGEVLGCGAFSRVLLAEDTESSSKRVAIKTQKLSKLTKRDVEMEYMVLRDLSSHANIPDFYGIYRREEEVWFVMELCEKGSVSELVSGLLHQNRRMAEEHIAYILKETAKAAAFLHENNIVHGDIKGSNILLTKEGEVKLVDFGASFSLDSSPKKNQQRVASPCWMAPELIQNGEDYGNKADIWALGITALEIAEGKPPHHSMHPTRAIFQIATNPPPTMAKQSNWTENYNDFVNECLAKNPEYRPYMAEIMEHPFLEQVPENNYHLTLEIKSLVEDVKRRDWPKAEPEVAIVGKKLKRQDQKKLEDMYVEDLASLDRISVDSVMNELEARFKRGNFQTFIGEMLLVLNPNQSHKGSIKELQQRYCSKSRSENAPHIYAVADSAYQDAIHHIAPQKIVLAGESGSGKTTTYLHLIDHLIFLGSNANINVDRIHGAINLIHSLINASTPINDFSTRSVFTTEIIYGSTGKVSGASFKVRQLEKWRVSSVDMLQGNFHFLYYIYDGLRESEKLAKFHLNQDREYRYLRVGEDPEARGPKVSIDTNITKFYKLMKVLEEFELKEADIDTICALVSSILLIGEIRFSQSSSGDATIDNKDLINDIADLLKIEAQKLGWALTNYCVVNKGSAFRKKSTVDEAREARDVLANTLYARLVDYLVSLITHRFTTGRIIFGEKYSIKIFDYFGFECFKQNDLQQLFANCFNEQLQYHYLQRVFSWECMDIMDEELEYRSFRFYDNKKTLDHLLGKAEGVLSFIDDASKKSQDGQYVLDFLRETDNNLVSVMANSQFAVAHYTGKVTYDVQEMPEKNRDFLPPEITETLRLSENDVVRLMFTNKMDKTGNVVFSFEETPIVGKRFLKFAKSQSTDRAPVHEYSQIKKMRTGINTFKALCLDLLKELSIGSGSGGTHFIRCIRSDIHGEDFNRELVKHQLRALAVVETAKARQEGFPHRIAFAEFLRRYQFLAFDFDENVEVNRDNCRLLLVRLKMEGWCIGKNKVFLKYFNEEYLSRLYETQVKKIIKIQSMLRGFLIKCRMAKEVERKQKQRRQSIIEVVTDSEMTEEEAALVIQKETSPLESPVPDSPKSSTSWTSSPANSCELGPTSGDAIASSTFCSSIEQCDSTIPSTFPNKSTSTISEPTTTCRESTETSNCN